MDGDGGDDDDDDMYEGGGANTQSGTGVSSLLMERPAKKLRADRRNIVSGRVGDRCH